MRKLTITGIGNNIKILLDDVPVRPTSVEIKMIQNHSEAILTFEEIQIQVDTNIENVRELTEKIKV